MHQVANPARLFYLFTFLPFYSFIFLPFYLFTFLPFYLFTFLPFYLFTFKNPFTFLPFYLSMSHVSRSLFVPLLTRKPGAWFREISGRNSGLQKEYQSRNNPETFPKQYRKTDMSRFLENSTLILPVLFRLFIEQESRMFHDHWNLSHNNPVSVSRTVLLYF